LNNNKHIYNIYTVSMEIDFVRLWEFLVPIGKWYTEKKDESADAVAVGRYVV
jgi:hypothetical protein